MDAVVTSINVKEEEDRDEKPAWLAEFPNSRGWEDLTLQEQVSGVCLLFLASSHAETPPSHHDRYTHFGLQRNGT